MISKENARDLLVASMSEFISKNNMQFTVEDLIAEINIVAVKYILDNYNPQTDTNPHIYLENNKLKYGSIAKVFATALSDQYPTVLTDTAICDLIDNVCNSISYVGTPLALMDYLRERHEISTGLDGENYDFISSRHERFQYETFVEASDVQRLIHINASLNWKNITVTITPTLSTKSAHLNLRDGRKLYYTGSDPDFQFIVELDDLDKIVFFSLVRRDRDLRLDYYR